MPLSEFDTEKQAYLVFENQCLYYQYLSKSECGLIKSKIVQDQGKIKHFACAPQTPAFTFYNFIYVNENIDDNDMKEALQIHKPAQSTVRLTLFDSNSKVLNLLEKNRFVKILDMKGGMYTKINTENNPKPVPDGFEIGELDFEKPDQEKRVKQWVECLKGGFGFIIKDEDVYVKAFGTAKIGPKAPLNCFYVIDKKTDKIVSVGSIYFDDYVCGVYNMATFDDYRGKGIASLVLDHMIYKRARDERKYTFCVLQPADKAIPLYERYGFKLIKGGEIYINGDNSSWIVKTLIFSFQNRYKILFTFILLILYGVYRFFY